MINIIMHTPRGLPVIPSNWAYSCIHAQSEKPSLSSLTWYTKKMDKIPDLMHGFLSHMNFATVIRPHILQFIRKLYSAIYLLVDVSFQVCKLQKLENMNSNSFGSKVHAAWQQQQPTCPGDSQVDDPT
ncbi:hypothetical protein M758_4G049800 [Ceratodon purpureus]|uniref:Uncharacterized protein n=1 Tax=Ceratodon purpureus TaxID=3225 RepID=A0A8T0I5D8_CERPU|nr:hypothetical protein KC19_4G052600 [Ceratodon purpureus]KAG0618259.1 hypothetical protein M758_4G049800 [Ceratodon purpureus]